MYKSSNRAHFSKRSQFEFHLNAFAFAVKWRMRIMHNYTVIESSFSSCKRTYWVRFSVSPDFFCFVSFVVVMQVYYIILHSHTTLAINYVVPNIFRMGFACIKKFRRSRCFFCQRLWQRECYRNKTDCERSEQ